MKRDTFSPYITTAGFEPAKREAQDLKSHPVDRTRERYLKVIIIYLYYNEMILFHSELLKVTNLLLQLGSNQRPIG